MIEGSAPDGAVGKARLYIVCAYAALKRRSSTVGIEIPGRATVTGSHFSRAKDAREKWSTPLFLNFPQSKVKIKNNGKRASRPLPHDALPGEAGIKW